MTDVSIHINVHALPDDVHTVITHALGYKLLGERWPRDQRHRDLKRAMVVLHDPCRQTELSKVADDQAIERAKAVVRAVVEALARNPTAEVLAWVGGPA